MRYHARPVDGPLAGEVTVPGDKSLSHRAVLFSAMAEGTSALTGVLDSADVRSTIEAVRALGARVETARVGGGLDIGVVGWGASGPLAPGGPVDCGNSGTTARLLMGVLAGWDVEVTLTGDESLSRRPMARVTAPLERMGAAFTMAEGDRLPVTVHGGPLAPIDYELPVASAQVKTAVLLAGTRAPGRTLVREPAPCRDHTERLLPLFGVPVGADAVERTAWVDGPVVPRAARYDVPGDPSSAAFLVAAALMVSGSDIVLPRVALNPTRVGFLRVLERMGADITVDLAVIDPEPVGRLRVRSGATLAATIVTPDEVPSLIDEVPVLAIVASMAEGTTRFAGVGELRVKESDRLEALAEGLRALGGRVRSGDDWLEVEGPVRLAGGTVDSRGDHRLAMAYAVAGLAATGTVSIDRFEAVDVSYPTFTEDLAALGVGGALR